MIKRQSFKPSNVDESLFGPAKGKSRPKSAPVVKRPTSATATYLTSSDLSRIKGMVVVKTPEEIEAEKKRLSDEKNEREKVQKARVARMKDLEQKAHAKKVKSDYEVADIARKEAVLKLANNQLDKENDTVKMLESLSARAVAFTVRDEQVRDKKDREKAEAEYNRRMDMNMEIDRLKELKRRQEEDEQRHRKQMQDRQVINEQLEYRRKQKLLALEARDRENMAIRATAARYKEEDEEKARQRAADIERSKAEVLQANEDAIRRKRERKEQEKREIQDILLYQKMKDAEALKREQEEAAVAHAKKETQMKLLAQQERAQNDMGKQDEIRARRAMEAHERRMREKEREEALKRKKENDDLYKARARQAEEKKKRLELEKLELKREQEQAFEYMARMQQREESEKNDDLAMKAAHRAALRDQMAEREFARKQMVDDDADIGTRRRQEYIREEEKLKVIRDQMLRDMENAGVNPKYLVEMKNIDIGKAIRR